MSHLPAKPDFEPQDKDKYPPEDRPHPRSRPPLYSRHTDRERSYRGHPDSYVPSGSRPPSIADSYVARDSYVAPSYDRRHDDRPRNYEGTHHPPTRQTWESDPRAYPQRPQRGWREDYDRRDPPPRHRQHDWRTRDDPTERRRDWEMKRGYPPHRCPPREPPRDYRRDRDYEQRPREDDRRYRREPSPSERRRPSRVSVSPSRRSELEARRRTPQRRSASPPPSRPRPPRSPRPSKNDEASRPSTPPAKTAVGRRSPSVTPRDQHCPEKARNHRSSSPRRASDSPTKQEKGQLSIKEEHGISNVKAENHQDNGFGSKSRFSKAKSRSPEPELSKDLKQPARDKGKARMPADGSTDAEGDTKMREPPSPPRQPRATINAPNSSQMVEGPSPTYPKSFRKSPPIGPRHYTKVANPIPSSPARTIQQSASLSSKPEWHRREPTPSQSQKASGTTEKNPPSLVVETIEPVIQLPLIPVYTPVPSITKVLDTEIKELQSHRARMVTEYAEISKAARRAVHELEMSTIDLNAARMRRETADAQMEKARIGLLGLDYEGVFPD